MEDRVTTPSSTAVFVARQCIYNRSLDVYSYELLFRSSTVNSANFIDGNKATTQVILNTFMEIGFDHVVANHKAFINITRDFIVGNYPIPFGKKQVVLEVLEDIAPDPEVLNALQQFKDKGFTIALDDFAYERHLEPFIQLADIIKIDIRVLNEQQIKEHVRELKSRGIKLLAEKVETKEEFQFCKDLGFDLFQGYFLSKPLVIEGKRLASNTVVLLKLIADLQNPDVEFSKLEQLIKRDASLSYKLLRYINSPAVATVNEITSLQHALVMLGLDTLKRWVSLIVLSGMADKATEIMRMGLLRARMCENLAVTAKKDQPQGYFMTGLFSMLDTLLNQPMQKVLAELPLSTAVTSALVDRKGELGEALSACVAYEEARWQDVGFCSLSTEAIKSAYLDAIQWADQSLVSLR